MSRNSMEVSKRVGFSSPDNENHVKPAVIYKKQGSSGTKVGGSSKKLRVAGIWSFRIPKSSSGFSPVRFLKCMGAEVAKALRLMSSRNKSSRKVSSASLTRSRSYAETLDSQRAEAIEDCIEFLNSSSSLQRSNSVASSC